MKSVKFIIFEFLIISRYELEYLRYIAKRKRLYLLNLYFPLVDGYGCYNLDVYIAWKDFEIEVFKSLENLFRP